MHLEGGCVISLSGDLEGEGEVLTRSRTTNFFWTEYQIFSAPLVQSYSPLLLLLVGHYLSESFKELIDYYREKNAVTFPSSWTCSR